MSARVGRIFRAPKRDRHGDPVDSSDNPVDMRDPEGLAFVGELKDIIMGGISASPSKGRQETSDTSGQIGCRTDLEPKVMFGDRIEIDGVRYQVTSQPEWGFGHSFSGSTFFNRYWVDVEARVGKALP